MRRAQLLSLIIMSAPGCTTPVSESVVPPNDHVMSVAEVKDNIDALNGQRVQVAGWLGECAEYSCSLFTSQDDARRFGRWLYDLANHKAELDDAPPELGLGEGNREGEWDARAAPFTNSFVVVTGRVTNECWYQGHRSCTGRGADLEPEAIRFLRPRAPTSGNKG